MPCLVIGGCGFLGRVIVEQLLAAGETSVRVLDLRKTFDDPRVEFVQGDICSLDDMLAATKGITTVFHTASPPHGKGKAVYFKINVDGTKNVVDACRKNGVPNLVYTSSASVVYNGQDLVEGDETLPYCEKHMDAYNESKAIAEEFVLQSNGKGLKTVCIRPSGIFGPRDMQGVSVILETCLKGKSGVQVGFNRTLFDWTFVDNVAHAHVLAMRALDKNPDVPGQVYNITNDQPIFFWDFVKLAWYRLGYASTLKFVLPLTLAFFLAFITEGFASLLSPFYTMHVTFTTFRIKVFGNNRYFNIAKAKRDLDYKPLYSLEEAIYMTVDHFKATNLKPIQ
ncbi:hypothetical protein HDU96_001707 [Phlyctochytrium bullatum]|nr:hypothetical protein HDU96_001707 [Phlyctochytrium bullatum]